MLICFLSGAVWAGELSLKECIDYALANNSGMRASALRYTAAEEEVKGARADFLPSLRFGAFYSYQDKRDRMKVPADVLGPGLPPAPGEFPLSGRDFYRTELSLHLPLFTGGLLRGRYVRAKTLSEEARLFSEQRGESLVRDVTRAFYDVRNAELSLHAEDGMLAAKKERLRVLHELRAEGYARGDEILLQEADVALSEARREKQASRLAVARSRLRLLMEFPDDRDLVLESAPTVARLGAEVGTLKAEALRNRRDLAAARERVHWGEAERLIARSSFLPSLSVDGAYRIQQQNEMVRPNQWLLTTRLDWPVFEWGKTVADVRRAEALKQSAAREERELEKEIAFGVEAAWRAVKDGERDVTAKEKRVRASRALLDTHLNRYREGSEKLSDLIEAEAACSSAAYDYSISLNDLHEALAELRFMVSGPLDQWVTYGEPYDPELGRYRELIRDGRKQGGKQGGRTLAGSGPFARGTAAVSRPEESAPAPPGALSFSKPSAGRIAVQVGAFSGQSNAALLRKEILKKTGGKSVIVLRKDRLYKVLVTGFSSRKEAGDFAAGIPSGAIVVQDTHGH
ncbi:MAG: TolC family protein [Geobacteraceae bacterium]|nr:TolC family protein [Geobacteraceae bacterium]